MTRSDLLLVLVAILIGLFVWAIMAWRTHVSTSAQNKLCIVLKSQQNAAILAARTPGTDTYKLARLLYPDPQARKRAIARAQEQADSLPC